MTEGRQPGYLVAVKQLLSTDPMYREELLREAAIMAQFQHDNVTGLVGVVTVRIFHLVSHCSVQCAGWGTVIGGLGVLRKG